MLAVCVPINEEVTGGNSSRPIGRRIRNLHGGRRTRGTRESITITGRIAEMQKLESMKEWVIEDEMTSLQRNNH